jgi:6-phosphogluconolactonase
LTYPALESSASVAFLVTGIEKHSIFRRFCHRDKTLPATNLRPSGALYVFADEAAANAA